MARPNGSESEMGSNAMSSAASQDTQCNLCRDRLLAVPSRTVHNLVGLTNATAANRIVADAIRLALTDLVQQAKAAEQESEAFLLAQESSANGQTADEVEL